MPLFSLVDRSGSRTFRSERRDGIAALWCLLEALGLLAHDADELVIAVAVASSRQAGFVESPETSPEVTIRTSL